MEKKTGLVFDIEAFGAQMFDAQKVGEAVHKQLDDVVKLGRGAWVMDEFVYHQDALPKFKSTSERATKKPWQKGFIPKQGKPIGQQVARQLEGFRALVVDGHVEYRRGDYLIHGNMWIGWTVAQCVSSYPWSAHGDAQTIAHFPQLTAAVVWLKLHMANNPGGDEADRQRKKAQRLGMQYGIGPNFQQLPKVTTPDTLRIMEAFRNRYHKP